MKKRNQLVSALLTGMLLGGTATAGVTAVPLDAAAEESSMELTAASEEESSEEQEEESAGTEEESGEDETSEESSEAEGTDSGAEEESDGEESESVPADSETESSPEDSESSQAENPSDDGKESGTDSSSSGTDSEAGSGDSHTDSTPSESDTGDDEKKAADRAAEEARRLAEEERKQDEKRLKEEEERRKAAEEAERQAEEERAKQLEEEKAAARQEKSAEKEDQGRKDQGAREQNELDMQAKAAAERAAEAEKKALESRMYGFAASDRAYYSGTYFVTNAQKRLALNVGFTRIDKVPAMSASGASVAIREVEAASGRVVGTLNGKDICYILEDESSGWVYVESGEVRGFAEKAQLKSGAEVEAFVTVTGETNLTTADQEVDPLENAAYRHSLNTTKDVASILQALGTASVDRQAMIAFSEQFIGNPYVWGGESLTNGCDCSGFTQQVYAQFGIALPRTSYEQAEVGVKIPKEEALPGDLLFYARDGVVYHVLMYVGEGKAINASSTATGIIIQDVDYDKVCWSCRYISDTGASSVGAAQATSTQASALQVIGQMAYEGDPAAQQEIISALAQASLREWQTYGFCRSVIIAQAINESGWLSFGSSAAGIQSTDNNILGMNEDLNNDTWTSPWGGKTATRLVPQYAGGGDVYNFESMRLYDDMEGCMEDYAAFKVGLHPDLIGETDVDKVIAVGLAGYATNPNYQSEIRELIDKYELTRFDEEVTAAVEQEAPADEMTAEDVELQAPELALPASDEQTVKEAEDEETGAPGEDSLRVEEPSGDESLAEEISTGDGDVQAEEIDAAEDGDVQAEEIDAAGNGDVQAEGIDAAGNSDDRTEEEETAGDNDDRTEEAGDAEPAAEEPSGIVSEDVEIYEEDIPADEEEALDPDAIEAVEDAEVGEEVFFDDENAAVTDAEVPTEEEPLVTDDVSAAIAAEEAADEAAASEATEGAATDETPDHGAPAETAVKETAEEADTSAVESGVIGDYSEEQLELIWAVVAQEDDTSYDGALAVISSVMNRADMNYGGFGTNAYEQLTAESQYAYSADVADPLYYQRRLGGNVPDYVKQAVSDCLRNGIRNNSYTSFRADSYVEGSVQIGANWYFYETAEDVSEAIANMADVIGEIALEIPDGGELVEDGVYDVAETPLYEEPGEAVLTVPEEEAGSTLVEEGDEIASWEDVAAQEDVILEAEPDFSI